MRFIQMWFIPEKLGLEPSVEQKAIEREERTNKFLPIISNEHSEALRIRSETQIFSSYLQKEKSLIYDIKTSRGIYLYVLEGGPIMFNESEIPELTAVKVELEKKVPNKSNQ